MARIESEKTYSYQLRVRSLDPSQPVSDQHAYPLMACYFTELNDLDQVDWDLLNRRDFRHDPGKKERYQAEALIWKHLPVEGLLGICSYSDAVDGESGRNLRDARSKCRL